MPKKVSSDFSYTLTYLTLKYERNRIFHPCRVMFDFYRQALLRALKTRPEDKAGEQSYFEGAVAAARVSAGLVSPKTLSV